MAERFFKRGVAYWRTSFSVRENGKSKRVRLNLPGVTTKYEAETLEAEIKAEYRKKANDRRHQPMASWQTLEEALAQDRARPGISDATRSLAREKAAHLCRILGGTTPIGDITTLDIERYKSRRLLTVSASTVNIELRVLRAAFNRWARLGLVERVPNIDMLPQESKRGRALTADEATALVKACHNDVHKKKSGRRLADLVDFMLRTGLRYGEVFRVRWSDIDFDEGTMRVETKKRGRSDAIHIDILPLSAEAQQILKRQDRKGIYVFGHEPSERNGKLVRHRKGKAGHQRGVLYLGDHAFRRRLKEAAARANIRRPDEVTPHCLRHTFCTLVARQEGVTVADAQALMRHRSPAMTIHYMHARDEVLRNTVSLIDAALGRQLVDE